MTITVPLASCLRSITLASATLVLFGGWAFGADDDDTDATERVEPTLINDLRLGYGSMPYKTTISNTTKNGAFAIQDYEKTTNWDATGRTGLTWMVPGSEVDSEGGFLFGLELSTEHFIINSGINPYISYRAVTLTAHPGIGWELEDRLQLEISPFVGVGYATTNFGSGAGAYWEFGLRTGLFYTFMDRVQIGANLYYMEDRDRQDVSADGNEFILHIRNSGPAAAISLGYRLP